MAFSDEVIKQAWERANAQCECIRRNHSHYYTPCAKSLAWGKKGSSGQGGWEAHLLDAAKPFTLENCEVVCWRCYEFEATVGSTGPAIS